MNAPAARSLPPANEAERFTWYVDAINTLVKQANEALGVEPLDFSGRVFKFGYIGNLGRFGDQRSWTVWMDTPETLVSGQQQQVPYFPTGDLDGVLKAYTFMRGVVAGLTVKPWKG